MAKVHHVKHARKAIRSEGIKVGDEYYWWKFRYGAKRVSKTYPKRQQLTQSDFLSQVYDLEDRINELSIDAYASAEPLKSDLDEIAADIRALGEEQDEKLQNMPEGLQQGATGELLQERYDACEAWADEIESIEIEEPDAEAIVDELREAEAKKDASERLSEEAIDEAAESQAADDLREALQAAIDEAQSAEVPS